LQVSVTGGSGFIGSHVVDRLVREGCGVTVLDNLSSGRRENVASHVENGTVEFVHGSLLDRRIVRGVVQGTDAVVHLAAVASIPYSFLNAAETHNVNVCGTAVLLEECARSRVQKLVFLSSSAVYGEARYVPIDEVHPTDPLSPYAKSKLEAETTCVKDCRNGELDVIVFRPFNVYGSRQTGNGDGGVIAAFAQCLANEKPLAIYGNGAQTRDFVHVSDVAEATWLALRTTGVRGVYNISSGRAIEIQQLAKLMADLVGVENPAYSFQDERVGDVLRSCGDYSKANRAFRYEPRTSLAAGLLELLTEPQRINPRVERVLAH
jgi:nucleoside-diphosphate-sugar epimerase